MDEKPADKYTNIQFAGDDFFIATTPSGHSLAVDVKGTRRSAPSPLELFLTGLGSCTAADVIAILQKKRQQVTAYRIEIRSERHDDHPRAFRRIDLKHFVRGINVSTESVRQAIELSTEKYCGAIATVRATAQITTSFEIQAEP